MTRITAILVIIAFAANFVSCKKEVIPTETLLYGTWIKGANAGDTLQFMRKNGKNIMRYNASFNATIPAFTEVEYTYQNEKLGVKLFMPATQDFYPVNSFSWQQAGVQFQVQGMELFTFLSSTQVYYTYRKI